MLNVNVTAVADAAETEVAVVGAERAAGADVIAAVVVELALPRKPRNCSMSTMPG